LRPPSIARHKLMVGTFASVAPAFENAAATDAI
jgi:hypothetical protein